MLRPVPQKQIGITAVYTEIALTNEVNQHWQMCLLTF